MPRTLAQDTHGTAEARRSTRPIPAPRPSRPPRARRWSVVGLCLAVAVGAMIVALPRAGGDATGYTDLPIAFEPNLGQAAPGVRYLARTGDYTAFLLDSEVRLSLRADERTDDVGMRFVGGSDSAATTGLDPLPGVAHYLRGDRPEHWTTGVPTYGGVRYDDVYPGVDAVFRDSGGGAIAYDFHVAPGADPTAIALRFESVDGVTVDAAGDLLVDTGSGVLRHQAPVAYQIVGGDRHEVTSEFTIAPDGTVSFSLGAYNRAEALVIDPVVTYSTYLGGAFGDAANAVAIDGDGSAYLTGTTSSADFPVTDGAAQTTPTETTDGFVAKLTADGSAIEYATYLGGAGTDAPNSIAVDGAGAAFVTGRTTSDDFPTTDGAFATARPGGDDAFVLQLTPDGSGFTYATYYGGSGAEAGTGIAVDDAGNAIVTGATDSDDLPTQDPLQAARAGGDDAFVAAFAPGGASLAYATYLGGAADDGAAGVAVDGTGSAYVTGDTRSGDFPTQAALQSTPPSDCPTDEDPARLCEAAFVTKLAPDGSTLAYSTYLSGTATTYLGGASDAGAGIAVDDDGAAYVVGETTTDDFPTQQAFQSERGGESDAFVAKLTPAGDALAYATYLGGLSREGAADVDVDDAGVASVTGFAAAGGLPTADPVAAYGGNTDAFLAQLSADGTELLFASTLGGPAFDPGRGVAVHATSGAVAVVGSAAEFFPVVAPLRGELEGVGSDAFVTRVDPLADGPLVTGLAPRSGPTSGATLVRIAGRGFTEDATVAFGGEPAADLRVESDTSLLAISPPGTAGAVPVTVTTPAGTSPDNPIARFEYAEGAWRATGDMVAPRTVHTATLLQDGRVLVAGGRSGTGGPAIASVELYDPDTDTWEAGPPLAEARFGHTATLLDDGRVLVAGGFPVGPPTNAQSYLDSTELYDPDTDAWSAGPPLGVRRALHTATELQDGTVLVAGGRTCPDAPPAECNFQVHTDTAEIFDPETGAWTPTGSMSVTRHTYPAVLLQDGRVLVAGGFGGEGVGSSVEIYDPATGEWTATGNLVGGGARGAAVRLQDGRVLLTGGFGSFDTTQLWDPTTGTWTATAPLSVGRFNHHIAVLPTGEVLVAGGGRGGPHAELYDPDAAAWESAGLMHHAHGSSSSLGKTDTATVLEDGSVLVAGNADLPAADRYVRTPQAEELPPLPEACPADEIPAADFTDRDAIPDAHQFNVDCAASYEIVTGFADGSYGPALDVRRDQMASFIARMLDAAEVALPEPTDERFTDVAAGSVHDDAIHRLAAAEIVEGGPGELPASSYGPGLDVRRDQMASFLIRAASFAVDRDLSSQTEAFADVPASNVHFGNVNGAAEAGLAEGFADGTYGPARSVRRDQMASFVVRLLDAIVSGALTEGV